MRYLVASTSLPRERIGVAGYAETRPIAPNDSLENRAKNRRVEFVFIRMVDPDDRTVSIDMSAPGGPLIPLSQVEWVEPEAIPFGPVELVPRAPLSSERVISDE